MSAPPEPSPSAAQAIPIVGLAFERTHDLGFLIRVEEGEVYRCVAVNAAYLAATGLTTADLVGRTVEEAFPAGPALDAVRARYARALATGTPQRYEEDVVFPAGRLVVETTLTPIPDYAGVCAYLLGMSRDVTARHAAEAARRASESRLQTVFAHCALGISIVDDAGRLVEVNPAFCTLVGRDAAALLGTPAAALSPPEDADVTRGPVAALRLGIVPSVSVTKRFVRPDGAVRWATLTMSRIALGDGGSGVLGVTEDVTERRKADALTRRLTEIVEVSPDPIAVSTPDGRVDYVNAAGRRLLGFGDMLPEGVREAGLRVEALQPQFAPGGAEHGAVRHAFRHGVWRGETTLRKRDGRTLPVEQVILTHRGVGGEVEFVSSLLRDVSDRKQAEATLRAFALVDELTGLYNRRGFLALAERECEAALAAGEGIALVYVDLDDLKPINDGHGHQAGDAALREAAEVLRGVFREADVLARLGGDEFVALARCGVGHDPAATAARVEVRLERAVSRANAAATLAARRCWRLSLSAGAAWATPTRPASLTALLAEADAALYEAKRRRKGRAA